MATPKTKRERYTDDSFESAEALQNFFRAGHTLKYDYVIVKKVLFTMEEYDMAGEYIIWANAKHKLQLRVNTADRYGD